MPGLDDGRDRVRERDWGASLVVVIGLVALLIAIVSGLRSQRAGLRTLPDEQRMALFSRTVDELRQYCGDGRADALEAHCRELATFAAQFDECRDDCTVLVRAYLAPRPTR